MKGNYVLTVAGAKGGVGKTTTSTNLGACFADAGYRTVVVEADLAMANIVDFVDIDAEGGADTLHDVLAGEPSILDAVHDVEERLSVVPSGTDIDRYGDLDVDRLEPAVERLWWHYNVVILDTPAGMGKEVIRPLELADEVVLTSTPRVSSIRNTHTTKELVERAGTDVRGLVLTKSGTGASPGADRIADFLDLELLGHVPEDDAVPHSQDGGEPVVEYAPRSGAAIAYRRIASQLIEAAGIDGEGRPRAEPSTGDSKPRSEDDPSSGSHSGAEERSTVREDATGGDASADVADSTGRSNRETGGEESVTDRTRPAADGAGVASGADTGGADAADEQDADGATAQPEDGTGSTDDGSRSRRDADADEAEPNGTSTVPDAFPEPVDATVAGPVDEARGDTDRDAPHGDPPDEGSDAVHAPGSSDTSQNSEDPDDDQSGQSPAGSLLSHIRSSIRRD